MLFPPFGPYQGTPVFEVQLRSNAAGDLLSFKYYDASEDAILDVVETYEFVINDILGDVINPIFFNIGVAPGENQPDWEDDPGAYEFTATISGGIVFDESGVQMGDEGDMFAAFDDGDRKSTRLNSSHVVISYAVFCLKKKTQLVTSVPPSPPMLR